MLTNRVVLAAVSLVLVMPSAARAAPPSSTPDAGTAGFDFAPHQLATNGHRTYVSGEFSTVTAPAGGDVLLSADTGRLLDKWPDFQGITAAVPDGSGGWYAADTQGTVRHLLPGGRTDPGFAPPKTDVDIKGVALSPDRATLWITGKFQAVGDQPRSGVAALRTSDGSLLPWKPEGGNAGWGVVATADTVYVAGSIYAGGTENQLAAFDAHTGAVRIAAVPGRSGDWGNRVALSPDGQTIYASFVVGSSLGGSARAFDAATLTQRWITQTGSPPVGMALSRGRVYLTNVGSVGGQERDGAVALDAATGALTSWFVPGPHGGLAVSPDGSEAYFTRAQVPGWPWQGGIAASTDDGALLAWTPSGNSVNSGSNPAISPDGKSVLLSSLWYDARFRRGAAMLDETGTVTTWVNPDRLNDRRVSSAAMDAAGTTYTTLMPRFSDDDGARSVEANDATGALRFQLALDGEATATLSPDQQTLYVVGSFASIGGTPRPGLAAVRTSDGSLENWPLTVSGGTVGRVVFSPDGQTMYLTGSFTAVNGVPRTRVAAVDMSTGAVLPFNPAPDQTPWLAISPDGNVVYLAGAFEHVAGRAQARLAGIRVSDGAVVFAPATEYNVFEVVALPDGRTVVASTDSPSRPLDSWDATTGQELSFGQNVSHGSVDALALDPDGQTLHVAGPFSITGGGGGYARFAVARGSAPANATPPRVVGDARTYQWVECDPGTWDGHPSSYAYSWTLDGAPVAGFTKREFLLQAGDEGRALSCSVSAGGAPAASAPVTVTPGEPFMFPPPRRTAGAVPPPVAEPEPTATPSPAPALPSTATADTTRVDRTPPRVTLRRVGRTARVRVSEAASVRVSLRRCRGRSCRTTTRKLTLGTRERVLARGLAKGRYTLTVRATDARGNTSTKVLRFTL